MPKHLQDFLRRASPLAVLAGLVSGGTLQADQKQAETESNFLALAAEHAEAVKDERREREPGPADRRRVRSEVLHARARMQHVRQAIEHLHAADLHDLAESVSDQVRNRIHDQEPGDRPGSTRERERFDQYERGTNDEVWRVVRRLGQAIENIERRVRESDEVRRAVEDAHRNVQHLQREFELRYREIEQTVNHHVREADRFIEEHSSELEEVIEDIEQHVDRRIDELEERLGDLYEHFETEDQGDDEEHKHDHQHDDEDDHEDEPDDDHDHDHAANHDE